MIRILYAVCPRCGMRAAIEKVFWDWDQEQDLARIRCPDCGQTQVPYSGERIRHIGVDPYLKEEPFDLLVPPDWDVHRWDAFRKCLARW